MKYIYLIPQGGFNDCLTELLLFQHYASQTGRILLFDFTNSCYKVNFSDYFKTKFNNVICDTNAIKEIILNYDFTVYPKGITVSDIRNIMQSVATVDLNETGGVHFKGIALKCSFKDKPNEDMIFASQCGGSPWGDRLFHNLKIVNSVKKYIIKNLKQIPLPYLAIQVRNTDYKCDYQDFILQNLSKIKMYKQVFLATDDKSCLDYCRAQGLNVINFTSFPQEEYVSLHTANINPRTKMLELLVDIFAVVGANELMSNSKGMFIHLLQNLRKNKRQVLNMVF
jgi:hypothetical protein